MPLVINSYTYWIRERIIFNIISNCLTSDVKIITADGKEYTISSYEIKLDKLAEKHRTTQHIPNEVCEQSTIRRVCHNNTILFQNNGSSTMQSDADVWFMLDKNPESMLNCLLKQIQKIHKKNKSLSKNYDLNIYLESSESVYNNLVKNTLNKETLKVYKDNIILKLYRHGIIDKRIAAQNVRKVADFDGAALYNKFEKQLNHGHDQRKLIKAEEELYKVYFKKSLIYAKNPTLKTLADAQLYKIEGYASILTLMHYMKNNNITFTDEMVEIIVMENIADMLIHLNCTGFIKKSKYLIRATRALLAVGMTCSNEQTLQIETLLSYSTLFDKTRKILTDHYSDYDTSVKVLLMQILNQIDSKTGLKFNPLDIANPSINVSLKDVKRDALKIVTTRKVFRCTKPKR